MDSRTTHTMHKLASESRVSDDFREQTSLDLKTRSTIAAKLQCIASSNSASSSKSAKKVHGVRIVIVIFQSKHLKDTSHCTLMQVEINGQEQKNTPIASQLTVHLLQVANYIAIIISYV